MRLQAPLGKSSPAMQDATQNEHRRLLPSNESEAALSAVEDRKMDTYRAYLMRRGVRTSDVQCSLTLFTNKDELEQLRFIKRVAQDIVRFMVNSSYFDALIKAEQLRVASSTIRVPYRTFFDEDGYYTSFPYARDFLVTMHLDEQLVGQRETE